MTTLETTRTIMRPLAVSDCAAVQRWASVPENVTYMPWGPNTDQDTTRFLETCEEGWAANPVRRYELGIILKENGDDDSGALIGSCGIYLNDDLCAAEVGWTLRRDYWKRGIMTEVAGALLCFGFKELHLHRIIARCDTDNYGSYRVMERNNMRLEGHYIKSRRLRNVHPPVWVDEYYYAILEEEY